MRPDAPRTLFNVIEDSCGDTLRIRDVERRKRRNKRRRYLRRNRLLHTICSFKLIYIYIFRLRNLFKCNILTLLFATLNQFKIHGILCGIFLEVTLYPSASQPWLNNEISREYKTNTHQCPGPRGWVNSESGGRSRAPYVLRAPQVLPVNTPGRDPFHQQGQLETFWNSSGFDVYMNYGGSC